MSPMPELDLNVVQYNMCGCENRFTKYSGTWNKREDMVVQDSVGDIRVRTHNPRTGYSYAWWVLGRCEWEYRLHKEVWCIGALALGQDLNTGSIMICEVTDGDPHIKKCKRKADFKELHESGKCQLQRQRPPPPRPPSELDPGVTEYEMYGCKDVDTKSYASCNGVWKGKKGPIELDVRNGPAVWRALGGCKPIGCNLEQAFGESRTGEIMICQVAVHSDQSIPKCPYGPKLYSNALHENAGCQLVPKGSCPDRIQVDPEGTCQTESSGTYIKSPDKPTEQSGMRPIYYMEISGQADNVLYFSVKQQAWLIAWSGGFRFKAGSASVRCPHEASPWKWCEKDGPCEEDGSWKETCHGNPVLVTAA